ncbi:VWA domain-containing protein [Candidatus Saccharibacteria bacterium]|nr:VWA domain-containing protein [Candidatus Saccharibacteria bacterium]
MDELNFDVNAQVAPNIDIDEIENDHMYLLGVVQDCSGSMDSYETEMKKALNTFVKSIQDSKQDDEMLVSLTEFCSTIQSSGFQNVKDMKTDFNAYGSTALYDAIIVAAKQLTDYKQQLTDSGVRTRAGLIIFSDGYDNVSNHSANDAAKEIKALTGGEIPVAFIAFGAAAHDIADDLGIIKDNIKKTDATPHDLRQIWNIISKSAISASKSAAAGASQSSFFDI